MMDNIVPVTGAILFMLVLCSLAGPMYCVLASVQTGCVCIFQCIAVFLVACCLRAVMVLINAVPAKNAPAPPGS